MKIQVIGSGCPTCKKLYEIVLEAATELNMEKNIEYLSGAEGIAKIIELGALSSPVLAIDGTIAMTGFTPDIEKIKVILKKHSEVK